MASKLEVALLHDRSSGGKICRTLCESLDDGTSLYRARAASTTLRDSIGLVPGRLWGVLYLHAPLRSTDNMFGLERLSPICHTLTVKIEIPSRKPDSLLRDIWTKHRPFSSASKLLPPQDLAAFEMDRQMWTYIFKRFTNLERLTLHTDGDPAWPGRGEVEHLLTSLRCSLERAGISRLRSLTLSPIHVCGILHLRWSGFGAFYEIPSPATCANLWQSITLLDIRLRSPMITSKLTEAQIRMSIKILQDYLRSFARNLRCLRFVWLDSDGPSPILLDQEAGMESSQRLFWPVLEELHFGNITTPNRTVQAILDRAPNIKVLKALRSTHRSSRMDPGNRQAWIDIGVERSTDRRRQVTDSCASSFYSQD